MVLEMEDKEFDSLFASVMDSEIVKKTAEKGIRKLDMYGEIIMENIGDKEIEKLKRLCEVTFPEKLGCG